MEPRHGRVNAAFGCNGAQLAPCTVSTRGLETIIHIHAGDAPRPPDV